MKFSNGTSPILTLMNDVNNEKYGGLDLQPEYQRGFVWQKEFKDKLIYSIVKKFPAGNISIRVLDEANDKGAKSEVVDGQQRLTTIRNFINGDYTINSEWSRKIINTIVDLYGDYNDAKYEKLKKRLKEYFRVL